MAYPKPFASQILDAGATGVSLVQAANEAAGRTALGLGTAATSSSSDFQPIDADLTAIAALSTQSYGRSLLTQSSQATLLASLGTGTPSASTYLRGDGAWSTAGQAVTEVPRSNLIVLWDFNENAGNILLNNAIPAPGTLNLLGATINQFNNANFWTKTNVTVTDNYAADPQGGFNASRVVWTAGTGRGLGQSVTLPAGSHTAVTWVKSNTGSSQTFRVSLDNTATFSSDQTATTQWQPFSYTASPGAGTTGRYIVTVDSGGNAADLLIWNPQLTTGSAPITQPRHQFSAQLGKTRGTDTTDPTWSTGYLGMQGSKFCFAQSDTPMVVSSITVHALCRWTGTEVLSGYSPIVGEEFTSNLMLLAANNAGIGAVFMFNGGTNYVLNNTMLLNSAGWHVLTGQYDAPNTTLNMFLDGVLIAQKTGVTLSPIQINNLYLGNANFAGYFPGDIAHVSIYNTAQTSAQVLGTALAIQNIGAAKGLSVSSYSKLLAFEGDSITDQTTGSSGNWPRGALLQSTPSIGQGRNVAVSGSTLTNATSRASSLDASYLASRSVNFLTLLMGRNDLFGAGSTTAFQTAYQTYCAARRAVGWKVAATTLLPSTASGFNTLRNTFNTWLRANYTSFADYLWDLGADATMGPDAAASNGTLYSDGTHPTATGQGYIATSWLAFISGKI